MPIRGRKICKARKRDGSPCGMIVMRGQDVCRMHGGMARQNRAAGTKRAETVKTRQKMEKAVAKIYGAPRTGEPAELLVEEIARTAGHVTWLQDRIGEYGDANLLTQTNTGPGGAHSIVPTVWLEIYWQERSHLAKVCTAAIRAGLAERQVRLAEQHGTLIAQVLRGVLADLGVDKDERVPAVIRKHLALVTSG